MTSKLTLNEIIYSNFENWMKHHAQGKYTICCEFWVVWSVCTIALVSGGMRRFYVDLRRVAPRSWSMQRKIGRPAAKQNLLPQNNIWKDYICSGFVCGWLGCHVMFRRNSSNFIFWVTGRSIERAVVKLWTLQDIGQPIKDSHVNVSSFWCLFLT